MPLVESVLHPTDLSDASEAAFAHALAIALIRQTRLNILHVGRSQEHLWTGFPPVRKTLERWGLLEKGSPRSAVFDELKVRVGKVALLGDDPLEGILEFLGKSPADLMVLATRGQEGMPRWLKRSVSEPAARRSKTMTLFVPRDARGFVSPEDGSLLLRRILIPVDQDPPPGAAIDFAMRAARAVGNTAVEITLLHIGESMPVVNLPEDPAWTWKKRTTTGKVVDAIIGAADSGQADLIAMVTAGHEGILDALRGSTTEQVLRRASCPVLAVPVAWVNDVS